eukprot:3407973-Rhodomonas_salina.1
MRSERLTQEALCQCVSHVVCACALDEYHGSVLDQITYEVVSYVNVPREFTIHRVVSYLDTGCVVLPHYRGVLLLVSKSSKHRSE